MLMLTDKGVHVKVADCCYRNLLNFEVEGHNEKINHTKIVYTVWFLYNKHCKNENISKENL